MTRPMAAWRTTYTPGQWLALTGPNTLVVMAPPPAGAAASVAELWSSVVGAGSLDALMNLVAEVGLDAMPDLGAFHWDDDGLHGIARGRVRILDAHSGDVVLQGEGAVTWREEHLGRERTLDISLEEPDGQWRLPLVVGAAMVASIQLTTDPAALVSFPAGEEPARGEHQEPAYQEPAHEEPAWVPEPQEEQASYDADDEVSFEAFDPAPDPLRAPTYEAGPEEIAAALAGVPAGLPGMPQTSGVSVPSPAAVDEFVPEEEQEPAQEDDEELVLAAPCTNGHANAPGSHRCRICKYPVDSSNPRLIRRPTLAGVHTNRGDFADVISGVIVGRAPDASKGPAGSYLMRVLSPGNDISRSHVLVSTQGWNVHVTDLHSTNGTTVLPDGEAPFTLRDGATVEVSIGTVLDLGDGVSLRIEPPRG